MRDAVVLVIPMSMFITFTWQWPSRSSRGLGGPAPARVAGGGARAGPVEARAFATQARPSQAAAGVAHSPGSLTFGSRRGKSLCGQHAHVSAPAARAAGRWRHGGQAEHAAGPCAANGQPRQPMTRRARSATAAAARPCAQAWAQPSRRIRRRALQPTRHRCRRCLRSAGRRGLWSCLQSLLSTTRARLPPSAATGNAVAR